MSHAVRRFGATPSPSGATFRLWAPAATSVEVVIDDTRFDMTRLPSGSIISLTRDSPRSN